jgi:colanic acid/amylovoran biosynthesis glycosyltransferase
MISVGHFHYCFFESSETFIYHQLTALKRYRPVAISLLSKNLDKFPMPNGSLYDVGTKLSRPGLQFAAPLRYYSLKLAAELFKREKVSLLHAHFGTWGAYAIPLKKSLRIPMIVTFYGQDVSLLPKRNIWRNRYSRLFEKADLFLAEGPQMMKELLKLGALPEKIAIQRIGIPLDKIRFRPQKQISSRPKALWAGRMIEKKGLLDALKAFDILKKNGITLELRVIGDGPERPLAENFAREKDMENVHFLGFLPYEEYLEEFEKADFFLVPSRTSKRGETEGGAPTTLLEAEARGLPVIATRHADIPFVLPQKYPYLANEADPENLAATITRFLDEYDNSQEIVADCRRHVELYHNLASTVDSLEKHYDRLLTRV